MKFIHGQRVTCEIMSVKITDAKISINEDGTPYICQNIKDGDYADDKLGYKYSWCLNRDFTNSSVTNLRSAEKSFDYPDVGDVYMDSNGDDGDEQTVLGVAGRLIFLSKGGNKDVASTYFTKEELIKQGYIIKQDAPEKKVEELTVDEISKRLGYEVKVIKD